MRADQGEQGQHGDREGDRTAATGTQAGPAPALLVGGEVDLHLVRSAFLADFLSPPPHASLLITRPTHGRYDPNLKSGSIRAGRGSASTGRPHTSASRAAISAAGGSSERITIGESAGNEPPDTWR